MRDLTQMFEPVVESMGYELVGVEFNAGGGHGTLRVYIDRARAAGGETPSFDPPGNIVFMTVDQTTGEPVAVGTPGAISEAFIQGTQPARSDLRY